MNSTILNFALGVIFVPLGLFIIVKRGKVTRMAIESQRRRLGRNENREGNPAVIAVVGGCIVAIGVALLVGSIVAAFSAA
jgi:hypothetical protein